MVRVVKVPLFQKVVRERLSEASLSILLASAERISEGQITESTKGEAKYYGSTMLTIDLKSLDGHIREVMDVSTAIQTARMLRTDRRVMGLLRAMALSEAERVAKSKLSELEMEVRIETRGEKLFVDLDVEATLRQIQPVSKWA